MQIEVTQSLCPTKLLICSLVAKSNWLTEQSSEPVHKVPPPTASALTAAS